ncbi:MAG: EAL domain-containing protein [Granulosicoccus sp.]
MGIRTKLLLCLLSVLIPVSVGSIFALYMINASQSKRVEAELANTRRLEAARINEMLENYREDAISLAAGTHIKAFVGAMSAWRRGELPTDAIIGGTDGFAILNPASEWPLQQLALSLQRKSGIVGSEVAELRVVDSDGHTLGESLGFSWQPVDPKLLEKVTTLTETRFGDAFRTSDGLERLGIITPVYGDSGTVVGALMLETRLRPIINQIGQHEGISETAEAHIAQPTPSGDAQFITPLRFDRSAAFDRVVKKFVNLPINQSLNAPGGIVLHAKDYRGVESLLAIETLPETGWGLVIKVDHAEAFAPVTNLMRLIAFSGMATLSFVLAGYWLLLRPLAMRLQRTAIAAQRVMAGDLESRIEDNTPDEVGHTARSIDRLARDLKADQFKRGLVEQRLRHQALHDDLTGLYNRQKANGVIRSISENPASIASIMFLDLDGFKSVNDLYGHAAGDAVLVAVAGRLLAAVPETATLARWGGDEFVIILPDADEPVATDFALCLQALFDDPVASDYGVHHIGCSIGLATSNQDLPLDQVIVEADSLMYEQKRLRLSSRSVHTVATRTVENALRENRVEVWYQPIVNVENPDQAELVCAEALVRLRSREGGIILPADFLGEVRKRRLGRELDHRVMTLSLEALARWRKAGLVKDDFRLTLNLTCESLADESLAVRLNKLLSGLSIPPGQLVIEISEETDDIDAGCIDELRELGVLIALDDVGLHRSNLDRLVSLSPHIAKIDRQWLNDDVVLPRLVDICHQLGMEVVAEGVENEKQYRHLRKLGVMRHQGFLFDRPSRAVQFLSQWGDSSNTESLDSAAQLSQDLKLVV